MIPSKLLIANRGEIAIRIIRAAAEMGIRTAAVLRRRSPQARGDERINRLRGVVESPLHSKPGSNFAFANRVPWVGV